MSLVFIVDNVPIIREIQWSIVTADGWLVSFNREIVLIVSSLEIKITHIITDYDCILTIHTIVLIILKFGFL